MENKIIAFIISVSILTGCVGLPRNGQIPTEKQVKRCEILGNTFLAMSALGSIAAAGSVAYGLSGGGKTAVASFFSSWGIGVIGFAGLYYLDKKTSCPMP
jgi:hypothetical protein